jgi:TIR domain
MPVAISYSHSDSEFAMKLTAQIFLHGGNVWIDQCEIVPGESIYEKVQEAFSSASVILALLSRSSVESVWCKREVAAGMTREMEENHMIVIPVLLDDCKVPFFLKDKRYVDFQKDFDSGIATLMTAIQRFGVHNAGRIEAGTDDFINDYSYEKTFSEGSLWMRFLLFQHSNKMPMAIFSDVTLSFNEVASQKWLKHNSHDNDAFGELILIDWACNHAAADKWQVILDDPSPVVQKFYVRDSKTGAECELFFSCRRLGDEIGRSTIVNGHYEFEKILDLMKQRVRPGPAT